MAAQDASATMIQGEPIKFRDGRYYIGKGEREASQDLRLGVIDVRFCWVRWENNRPVEQIEQTSEDLISRDTLGHLDEAQWEHGMNGPRDPWQDMRYLYLIDPKTAFTYTFVTQTIGGKNAVGRLAAQIARVQRSQPGALPYILLRFADMTTQYGKKTKPHFEVVGWTQGIVSEAQRESADPTPKPKMTITSGRNAPRVEDLDDDIPF